MELDEYRLVMEWGANEAKAAELELAIAVEKGKKAVQISVIEDDSGGETPIALVRMEFVSSYLEGFKAGRAHAPIEEDEDE